MSTPVTEKTILPQPPRRRFSKRRISNALTAAHNAGMAVRELKIGVDGEIDITFGKPPDEEPEDLAKLL
jgi:hypothetical protein